jgi:hypothetical protein
MELGFILHITLRQGRCLPIDRLQVELHPNVLT